MDLCAALILAANTYCVSLPVSNTFFVHFEILPTPWVSKQNKASQRYLALIHCLLFVRLVTNNHVKKPRPWELTLLFSAGCFAEPSPVCHPLLHCVLRGSGHVQRDVQVSSTLPSHRTQKLRSNMKWVHIQY